ncbi:MAG TPA: hypothetical protein VKV30_08740 [Candidatus Angelobacter sp.]|nr:hypothetical protein [Candidatus Angelobacter sp.]
MATEIELLAAVQGKTYEACEQEWKRLLQELRLGLLYVPAIQEVLEEGRWKEHPNPMAYVRKGAVRCAVRMGIVDIRPNQNMEILACDLQYRDEEGEQLEHDDKLGMALNDYEDKFGSDTELHSLEDDIADALKDKNLAVDWERVAELTDLDPGERLVMELRVIGFGREAALEACFTDADRLVLQAAWRRFERHKGAMSAVLLSGEPQRARRLQREPESEPELIFIETPEGKLKISFRKLVPES